jgi:pseudouridylate synthase
MKIQYTDEVRKAVVNGHAVVALESTIIAHGMPFPQNLQMAREVEQVVRRHGAVPATIAIVDGKLRAGLADTELQHFARSGPEIPKVSSRDIPYIVAKGLTGATTVASTMRIAALAGIHVFATGGIGGAHRSASETFDISNDLHEFAISDVAVITAGAKAILDLPMTLEVLETNGVPVVGLCTDEFPAFYSRSSGLKVPMRLDSAKDIAAMMVAKWKLGLKGGIVVANPIPAVDEIPAQAIEPHISKALAEARLKNVRGKDVTPFLLKRIAEITGGRSLTANIALVMNNARVAAEIAVAFSGR